MLSLVIGCLNEGDHLRTTLEEALALQPPSGGLEISIFDDGSTDGCTAFLDQEPWLEHRRAGWLRLQRSPVREGISRGRYQAALGCQGDVLVFMDAHLSFPLPDFWLQVDEHFRSRRSDLLAVDCRDQNGNSTTAPFYYTSRRLDHMTPQWALHGQHRAVGAPLPIPFVNGGFFAIRRAVYERLRGFPLFLQGWGHEDRYLSTLAAYFGYRAASQPDLFVHHLYKDSLTVPTGEPAPHSLCADPRPGAGVPLDLQPDYHFATSELDATQILLMNSLRCAEILYSADVRAQMLAQLSSVYAATAMQPVLDALRRERPQLQQYLERLGLNALQRDEAMRLFHARWKQALPMLVEVNLQAARALPPAEALAAIQALPLELSNLSGVDAEEFTVARLYLEANAAYQLANWNLAISCLTDLLAIQPDYLPALRLLTGALQQKGRHKAYRHWLLHSHAVIERHQATYGPGPLAAWHPACTNQYLQHLYVPEADRAIWFDLAQLEISEHRPAQAAIWLTKLLDQCPDDAQALAMCADLFPQASAA